MFKYFDLPLTLPQFNIVTVNKLLGLLPGRVVVFAHEVNDPLIVPVRSNYVRAIMPIIFPVVGPKAKALGRIEIARRKIEATKAEGRSGSLSSKGLRKVL